MARVVRDAVGLVPGAPGEPDRGGRRGLVGGDEATTLVVARVADRGDPPPPEPGVREHGAGGGERGHEPGEDGGPDLGERLGLGIANLVNLLNPDLVVLNRTLELASISRSLKGLAKELGVPILVLSQLSRAPESRSDRRPQLSDLRESGALEQDADVVMMIFRPGVYEKDNPDLQNVAEIIIAKQRNGPIGTANLAFLGQYTLFANIEQGMA